MCASRILYELVCIGVVKVRRKMMILEARRKGTTRKVHRKRLQYKRKEKNDKMCHVMYQRNDWLCVVQVLRKNWIMRAAWGMLHRKVLKYQDPEYDSRI